MCFDKCNLSIYYVYNVEKSRDFLILYVRVEICLIN